jgi:hypothetical protein
MRSLTIFSKSLRSLQEPQLWELAEFFWYVTRKLAANNAQAFKVTQGSNVRWKWTAQVVVRQVPAYDQNRFISIKQGKSLPKQIQHH